MAVKDGDAFHSTESLILSKPRRHFRTPVPVIHWQLCSLISAEKKDIIYYPSGKDSRDIVRLNTTTAETETVKRLQFQPRSVVAQRGWVCCGGENGVFSAIQLEDSSSDRHADARLSLGLMHSRLDEGYVAALARARANKNFFATSKTFGKERVNCVTLWFPPTLVTPFRGAYDQPVAVLANNDKSVHFVTLEDQEAIEEVSYPDCVNRAVISPDGQTLAAICDDPYLYIHERVEKASLGRYSSYRRTFEWRACGRIFLKSQKLGDKSDERGSFAICFSSTGKYLAVGTQYGHISVFDAGKLGTLGADAVIADYTTTRPNNTHGAVRDMAFAPGPHDLLAWTEDRGRVGVADLRRGFATRQVLHLDKTSDFEHLSTTDRSTIDPRLLNNRGERSDRSDRTERTESLASSFLNSMDQFMDYQRSLTSRMTTDNSNNQTSEASREPIDPYRSPLTSVETSVLEALSEHRRRREQRAAAAAAAAAAEVARPTTLLDRSSTRSTTRPSNSIEGQRPERSASASRAVSDIIGSIRDQRERLRDSQERLRASMRQDTQDRLRASLGEGDEEALRNAAASRRFRERRQASMRQDTQDRLRASLGENNEEALRASAAAGDETEERIRALQQGEERFIASLASTRRNDERTRAREREETSERLQSLGRESDLDRLRGISISRDDSMRAILDRARTTHGDTRERVQEPPRASSRENASDRTRPGDDATDALQDETAEPRRLTGLVTGLIEPRRSTNPVTPSPINERQVSRLMANPSGSTTSGGWADVEAMYQLSFDGGHSYEYLQSAVENQNSRPWADGGGRSTWAESATPPRERERSGSARDPYEDIAITRRGVRMNYGSNRLKTDSLDTSGLSWSDDGQILYIGTLNGIYEFHVNLFGRKFFPSITLR